MSDTPEDDDSDVILLSLDEVTEDGGAAFSDEIDQQITVHVGYLTWADMGRPTFLRLAAGVSS